MVWFGLVWYGLVWFCWYSLVWGGGQMTSEFIPEEISKCEISHFFFRVRTSLAKVAQVH